MELQLPYFDTMVFIADIVQLFESRYRHLAQSQASRAAKRALVDADRCRAGPQSFSSSSSSTSSVSSSSSSSSSPASSASGPTKSSSTIATAGCITAVILPRKGSSSSSNSPTWPASSSPSTSSSSSSSASISPSSRHPHLHPFASSGPSRHVLEDAPTATISIRASASQSAPSSPPPLPPFSSSASSHYVPPHYIPEGLARSVLNSPGSSDEFIAMLRLAPEVFFLPTFAPIEYVLLSSCVVMCCLRSETLMLMLFYLLGLAHYVARLHLIVTIIHAPPLPSLSFPLHLHLPLSSSLWFPPSSQRAVPVFPLVLVEYPLYQSRGWAGPSDVFYAGVIRARATVHTELSAVGFDLPPLPRSIFNSTPVTSGPSSPFSMEAGSPVPADGSMLPGSPLPILPTSAASMGSIPTASTSASSSSSTLSAPPITSSGTSPGPEYTRSDMVDPIVNTSLSVVPSFVSPLSSHPRMLRATIGLRSPALALLVQEVCALSEGQRSLRRRGPLAESAMSSAAPPRWAAELLLFEILRLNLFDLSPFVPIHHSLPHILREQLAPGSPHAFKLLRRLTAGDFALRLPLTVEATATSVSALEAARDWLFRGVDADLKYYALLAERGEELMLLDQGEDDGVMESGDCEGGETEPFEHLSRHHHQYQQQQHQQQHHHGVYPAPLPSLPQLQPSSSSTFSSSSFSGGALGPPTTATTTLIGTGTGTGGRGVGGAGAGAAAGASNNGSRSRHLLISSSGAVSDDEDSTRSPLPRSPSIPTSASSNGGSRSSSRGHSRSSSHTHVPISAYTSTPTTSFAAASSSSSSSSSSSPHAAFASSSTMFVNPPAVRTVSFASSPSPRSQQQVTNQFVNAVTAIDVDSSRRGGGDGGDADDGYVPDDDELDGHVDVDDDDDDDDDDDGNGAADGRGGNHENGQGIHDSAYTSSADDNNSRPQQSNILSLNRQNSNASSNNSGRSRMSRN